MQKAFLKWAGGKGRLASKILSFIPKKTQQNSCLIEPFVGAGSIFLHSDFKSYILCDINQDLINLYKIIQNDSENYIKEAKKLFNDHNSNSKQFYLQMRQKFNLSNDIFEKAILFLYLNRFGYNGLCRYNRQGQFNVPFGSYAKPYFPELELYFFAEKSQKAIFLCQNFTESFDLASQNDNYVIYCDPPYLPIKSSDFTQYSKHNFTLEEHQKLVQKAKQTAQKNTMVLISNNDTKETRKLYQGAKFRKLQARRTIAQSSKNRKKVNELVAIYR